MTGSNDGAPEVALPEVALPPSMPRVQIGAHVEVELWSETGDVENAAFDVVPDRQADFASGFLGAGTPLGQAILGQPAGSAVHYHAADIVGVRVLSVSRSTRSFDEAAIEARRAVTQAAEERAKTDEMVQLALTVNVKWGGYDPEPLEGDARPDLP